MCVLGGGGGEGRPAALVSAGLHTAQALLFY